MARSWFSRLKQGGCRMLAFVEHHKYADNRWAVCEKWRATVLRR